MYDMNGVSMTMACFNFSNKPTLFCLCHIQSVKHQYMMIVLCQRYYVTFHGYFQSTAPWVKTNKLYCMHITIRDMKNSTTNDKDINEFSNLPRYFYIWAHKLRDKLGIFIVNSNVELVSMWIANQNISSIGYIDAVGETGYSFTSNSFDELSIFVYYNDAMT